MLVFVYVLYKTFFKIFMQPFVQLLFPTKKTCFAEKKFTFVFFFPAKHGFAIFYTEWPSINVTACLTSKPLISRFSNKSIINFTAVRPFSVTS